MVTAAVVEQRVDLGMQDAFPQLLNHHMSIPSQEYLGAIFQLARMPDLPLTNYSLAIYPVQESQWIVARACMLADAMKAQDIDH